MRGVLHLEPIRAGHPDIAHAAFDLIGERLQRGGVDDSVDFDVLEQLQAPLLLRSGRFLLLDASPRSCREIKFPEPSRVTANTRIVSENAG